MILLRSQKNTLFDLINSTNYFTPSNFEVEEYGQNLNLYFPNTDYHFAISESGITSRDFYMRYSPAKDTVNEEYAINWSEMVLEFKKWLTYLEREVSIEDKWARILAEASYLMTSVEESSNKFSHEEYLDITVKFNYIKANIRSIPLQSQQIDAINSKLDHLLEMTTKLNKFDWQNLFVGIILSIVIQLGVTQENAKLLYELIKQTFRGKFLQ
jgi:hypothetical protein